MWSMRKKTVADEPVRCPHTLVRHGDGTDECEGGTWCQGDPLLHEWELDCHELACGCVGEEHDLVLAFAA
jgi:hypothetical protein